MLDPVKYEKSELFIPNKVPKHPWISDRAIVGCDIALAKGMNASTNVGYEVVLGIVSSSD